MTRKLPINEYLTVAAVARRHGVGGWTVRRWIASGLLRGVAYWCGRLRVHPDIVEAFTPPTRGRPMGKRHRRILALAGEGLDRKQIAAKVRVVPEYVRRILKEARDA